MQVSIINFFFFTFADVEVSFSQDSYTVAEGDNLINICVNLSGVIERNVTVTFTTVSLTAQGFLSGDRDFIPVVSNLTFQPGSALQHCTPVIVEDDSILEIDEVFSVILSTRDWAVNFGQESANITIIDDDSKFLQCISTVLTFRCGNQAVVSRTYIMESVY